MFANHPYTGETDWCGDAVRGEAAWAGRRPERRQEERGSRERGHGPAQRGPGHPVSQGTLVHTDNYATDRRACEDLSTAMHTRGLHLRYPTLLLIMLRLQNSLPRPTIG